MNRKRADGLMLVSLGALVLVLLGVVLERSTPEPLADLRGIYFPARCLLQQGDPYTASEVLRVYRAEGADRATDSEKVRQIATRLPYLPTVFVLSLPIALMPWGVAQAVWIVLTAGGLIGAGFLIWNLSADAAPILAGFLIGFMLANSEVLVVAGNAAGIVVSLCVLAVWCFVRRRYEAAGVVSLALALAVKPQDAGFVWLYFLIAGGAFGKRAWQTLLVVAALGLACALWLWHVAPHWQQQMQANIAAYAVHGGINDPGPASQGAHGLAMVVSLQAVFSLFRDDPRFYDLASYLVCTPILLAWIVKTTRSKMGALQTWLGLAVIASLTMLPVYHRQYDTKLLLLTVPACAMLWVEGSRLGRFAVIVNGAAIVLNGDLTWAPILGIVHGIRVPAGGLAEHLQVGIQVLPAPLSLLASSVVFLWLYWRHDGTADPAGSPENGGGVQPALRG